MCHNNSNKEVGIYLTLTGEHISGARINYRSHLNSISFQVLSMLVVLYKLDKDFTLLICNKFNILFDHLMFGDESNKQMKELGKGSCLLIEWRTSPNVNWLRDCYYDHVIASSTINNHTTYVEESWMNKTPFFVFSRSCSLELKVWPCKQNARSCT